ncbi:MAG: hypothetical protein ACREMO_05865, partial [Gemmatimonadales bacterium]
PMLLALIATLIMVNLGVRGLLYVQSRQAAREREAIGAMTAKLYEAAVPALTESHETSARLRAAHGQFEQDRLALLEALRTVAGLRLLLAQDLRGGALS